MHAVRCYFKEDRLEGLVQMYFLNAEYVPFVSPIVINFGETRSYLADCLILFSAVILNGYMRGWLE